MQVMRKANIQELDHGLGLMFSCIHIHKYDHHVIMNLVHGMMIHVLLIFMSFLEAWLGKSSTKKICIQQVMHCADFVEYFQVPCFYRTAPKEAVAMQAQLILMMPTMKQSIRPQIYIRHN